MKKWILLLLVFALVISLVLVGCTKTVPETVSEKPVPPQPPRFEEGASAESKKDLQPPALPS